MPTDPRLPEDFAADVLKRTTGSACESAEPLLTALVDGELEPAERELVEEHAVHCASCRALVAALVGLGPELRAIAEVEPDSAFVEDVLASTCDAPPMLVPEAADWAARLRGLLLRPRFSLEAAFVGSILFAVIFGIPGSRFAPVSRAAVAEEIRVGAGERLEIAHRVWDRSSDTVVESLTTTGRALLRTARSLAGLSAEAEPSSPPSPFDSGAGASHSPGEKS